jgi:hypothetical protein
LAEAQIAMYGQKPYASNAAFKPLLTSQRKAVRIRLQTMTRTAGPRESLGGEHSGTALVIAAAFTWDHYEARSRR